MATRYLGKVTSESEQRQFGCVILSTNERITWSRWINAFGRVQPQDIGKKVFDVAGVLQMESQEQKAEREAREAHHAFSDDGIVIEITRLPGDSFCKWRVTVYSPDTGKRPQCFVNSNVSAAVDRLLEALK